MRGVCTFDGEHGARDGVQSLIRHFACLIQLHVLQREEPFPAFGFNVARLKHKRQTDTAAPAPKLNSCKTIIYIQQNKQQHSLRHVYDAL